MEFHYKPEEVPVSENTTRKAIVWRPIMPVILIKNKSFVGYEALLDTGADYNVFHSEIAQILGIKLTTGKSRKIYGLGGQHIKGYIHKVELKLQGFPVFVAPVIFSSQIPKHAIGVFGNTGFFDHFKSMFNYKEKTIEINSN